MQKDHTFNKVIGIYLIIIRISNCRIINSTNIPLNISNLDNLISLPKLINNIINCNHNNNLNRCSKNSNNNILNRNYNRITIINNNINNNNNGILHNCHQINLI